MKHGALIYDSRKGCYDIRFDLDDYYGGLRDGEVLEVFTDGGWHKTHMEYDGESWRLTDIRVHDLRGLIVRVEERRPSIRLIAYDLQIDY